MLALCVKISYERMIVSFLIRSHGKSARGMLICFLSAHYFSAFVFDIYNLTRQQDQQQVCQIEVFRIRHRMKYLLQRKYI